MVKKTWIIWYFFDNALSLSLSISHSLSLSHTHTLSLSHSYMYVYFNFSFLQYCFWNCNFPLNPRFLFVRSVCPSVSHNLIKRLVNNTSMLHVDIRNKNIFHSLCLLKFFLCFSYSLLQPIQGRSAPAGRTFDRSHWPRERRHFLQQRKEVLQHWLSMVSENVI